MLGLQAGPDAYEYLVLGLFVYRDFQIRDGDTIYVTEAPYVQWQKTLSVLTGTATSANSLNQLATGN